MSLSGVTLSLGRRTILSGITLAIDPATYVGVLGPNGAGKTTLLRALLGLVPPSAAPSASSASPRGAATPRSATCRSSAPPRRCA